MRKRRPGEGGEIAPGGAWKRYADAVIAFNTARTGANAQALARSYRDFVSLFAGPGRSVGKIVDLDAMRPRDVP